MQRVALIPLAAALSLCGCTNDRFDSCVVASEGVVVDVDDASALGFSARQAAAAATLEYVAEAYIMHRDATSPTPSQAPLAGALQVTVREELTVVGDPEVVRFVRGACPDGKRGLRVPVRQAVTGDVDGFAFASGGDMVLIAAAPDAAEMAVLSDDDPYTHHPVDIDSALLEALRGWAAEHVDGAFGFEPPDCAPDAYARVGGLYGPFVSSYGEIGVTLAACGHEDQYAPILRW